MLHTSVAEAMKTSTSEQHTGLPVPPVAPALEALQREVANLVVDAATRDAVCTAQLQAQADVLAQLLATVGSLSNSVSKDRQRPLATDGWSQTSPTKAMPPLARTSTAEPLQLHQLSSADAGAIPHRTSGQPAEAYKPLSTLLFSPIPARKDAAVAANRVPLSPRSRSGGNDTTLDSSTLLHTSVGNTCLNQLPHAPLAQHAGGDASRAVLPVMHGAGDNGSRQLTALTANTGDAAAPKGTAARVTADTENIRQQPRDALGHTFAAIAAASADDSQPVVGRPMHRPAAAPQSARKNATREQEAATAAPASPSRSNQPILDDLLDMSLDVDANAGGAPSSYGGSADLATELASQAAPSTGDTQTEGDMLPPRLMRRLRRLDSSSDRSLEPLRTGPNNKRMPTGAASSQEQAPRGKQREERTPKAAKRKLHQQTAHRSENHTMLSSPAHMGPNITFLGSPATAATQEDRLPGATAAVGAAQDGPLSILDSTAPDEDAMQLNTSGSSADAGEKGAELIITALFKGQRFAELTARSNIILAATAAQSREATGKKDAYIAATRVPVARGRAPVGRSLAGLMIRGTDRGAAGKGAATLPISELSTSLAAVAGISSLVRKRQADVSLSRLEQDTLLRPELLPDGDARKPLAPPLHAAAPSAVQQTTERANVPKLGSTRNGGSRGLAPTKQSASFMATVLHKPVSQSRGTTMQAPVSLDMVQSLASEADPPLMSDDRTSAVITQPSQYAAAAANAVAQLRATRGSLPVEAADTSTAVDATLAAGRSAARSAHSDLLPLEAETSPASGLAPAQRLPVVMPAGEIAGGPPSWAASNEVWPSATASSTGRPTGGAQTAAAAARLMELLEEDTWPVPPPPPPRHRLCASSHNAPGVEQQPHMWDLLAEDGFL